MTNQKAQIALGNLAIASAIYLASSHQGLAMSGWMVKVAAWAGVAGAGAALMARHQNHELSATDYRDGVMELYSEARTAITEIVPTIEPQKLAIAAFPKLGKLTQEASLEPISKLPVNSYVVYAGKGSGKTQLFYLMARQFVRSGAIVRISDPHAGGRKGNIANYGEILPGIQLDQYMVESERETLELFRRHRQCFEDRKSGKDESDRPVVLMVDEYQELFNVSTTLTKEEQDEIIGIISIIENQARKYGLYTVISTKSLKLKGTGIDSTILSQFSWLVLNGGFSDANTRWPHGVNPSELGARQSAVGGFAPCYINALKGTQEIWKLPSNEEVFKIIREQSDSMSFSTVEEGAAEYLERNDEAIAKMVADGKSATAIAQSLDGFGRRDDSNPKWDMLKEVVKNSRTGETVNV